MNSNSITVQEAATILGIDSSQVRRLIRRGTIKADRFGDKAWLVDPDSVNDYAQSPRKVGHPRKPKEEQA